MNVLTDAFRRGQGISEPLLALNQREERTESTTGTLKNALAENDGIFLSGYLQSCVGRIFPAALSLEEQYGKVFLELEGTFSPREDRVSRVYGQKDMMNFLGFRRINFEKPRPRRVNPYTGRILDMPVVITFYADAGRGWHAELRDPKTIGEHGAKAPRYSAAEIKKILSVLECFFEGSFTPKIVSVREHGPNEADCTAPEASSVS